MADVRAFQRTTRQSPYKMRLVIDQIRGKGVNEALALLQFSKKHAARQIEKVLHSAVANAEHRGRTSDEPVDVDTLYVKHAVINEGPKLKRFMPAAMGRATPIIKRTSHVEIVVAPRPVRTAPVARRTARPATPGPAPAGGGRRRTPAKRAAPARGRNPKRGQ
jgi:large subunit ribosomal protein L22